MAGDVAWVFKIFTSDCEQKINTILLNHSVPHREKANVIAEQRVI